MPGDYEPAAKLLHRLTLGSTMVAETSFDLEQALHGRRSQVAGTGSPVFVAGLARAGTTMLMRMLHDTQAFCSLTYRDMPFVLAPNTWARLTGLSRRDVAARERAHGDGIIVDVDSPEALEEVFWRVFCGPAYIGPETLRPMEADDDVLEQFRRYVAIILKRYQADRYLSKNNNNLLRLPSLRRAFPNAVLLVPFRDPMQHARSLLGQHQRFVTQQSEDPFARTYMTWLVHHEFGLDHRPFDLLGGGRRAGDPADLSYWLRQWTAAYDYVWRQAQAGSFEPVFVSYELLCAEPARACDGLAKLLGLPRASIDFQPRESRTDVDAVDDARLVRDARQLYETMQASSRASLLS